MQRAAVAPTNCERWHIPTDAIIFFDFFDIQRLTSLVDAVLERLPVGKVLINESRRIGLLLRPET